MKNSFLLSVIIPVYNEEKNIPMLLKNLIPEIKNYAFEIIFVNDGSNDNTAEIIKNYAKNDKRIKLISFVRNFGHQCALTAGYNFAKGNAIVTIDADLQDPPSLIPQMIQLWQKGAKIVYAKRKLRKESFFKRNTARIFYRLLNILSDVKIPEDVGDFRLLDKEVVDFLNSLPEKSRFLRGLVAWSGFPSKEVYFDRKKRLIGETHYPLSKMIALATNGIISFSTRPLSLALYTGIFSFFAGLAGILFAVIKRIFLPASHWTTSWTNLVFVLFLIEGFQLIAIGIIGEYLGKVFKELQGRPLYIISEKINI